MALGRVALRADDREHAAASPAAAVAGARSLRLVARLIDTALLAAVVALVWTEIVPRVVGVADDRRDLYDSVRAGDGVLRLVLLGVAALMEVLPVARWGWTPGKLVMGLRVRAADDAPRPGLVRAAVRWLPVAAVLVLPYAAPLYLVVVAPVLGRRREGLHDRLAASWVADAPPVT